MTELVPCLWFDGCADEAVRTYSEIFGDVNTRATTYYAEGMHLPAGAVLTIDFVLRGQRFTALNAGPEFRANPSVSFFVHVDGEGECTRLVEALARGGRLLMPLAAYPWSARYAWVQDRFGVSWQVITGRRPASGASIVPCLMFSDAQHGRAERAMAFYASLFAGSRVERIERYAAGEGDGTGVKHGPFVVAGQPLVAMDSHVRHGFAFNEAISLQALCDDQGEVDRLWSALTEGGRPGLCGWLQDRFGVSWQVAPREVIRLQQLGNPAANARLFQALMKMSRLELAPLERAWRGEPG